jgi:hypothetical protein
MATSSEVGNFLRDILGTLSLCGDCAEPWPFTNEVQGMRGKEETIHGVVEDMQLPQNHTRDTSNALLEQSSKNLCSLGAGSELQQLELPVC